MKAGLRLKPRKCLLLRDEVPYLGHVVSKAGIGPDPAKIEQVKSYPVPSDVTKVRQFLGLASYILSEVHSQLCSYSSPAAFADEEELYF